METMVSPSVILVVSAVVPMRRELKITHQRGYADTPDGFSSCPDEEGTENHPVVILEAAPKGFQQLSR